MSAMAPASVVGPKSSQSSKNSALTDAWLRLQQSSQKPPQGSPQEPEPQLHPIFEALSREAGAPPRPRPPQWKQETPKKTPQETPRIRIADQYAFVLDKQETLRKSIWSNQATWPERVCRQALPDHFESDKTYLRVPGVQCPEPTCGAPPGSQAQGLWLPDQEGRQDGGSGRGSLYVVHGCTRCGQRRLLARDADMRVVYS